MEELRKGRHALALSCSSQSQSAYVLKPTEWVYKTVAMTNNINRLYIQIEQRLDTSTWGY